MSTPLPVTAAIQVNSVSKRYGSLVALDAVDLKIESGEFFGLLGPNGAGKTTLISIIAGLVRASSGSVRIMGHDVVDDFRAARLSVGVVPQELAFDPFFTVRETLTFQSGYFGLRDNGAWLDEVLENLGLASRADTNTRALSGGMKRRLLVAQALVHKPPVIVLDEPTAGVDVELRQTLWQFIRRLNREGHTIVLTTHYLEEAQALCGRIAMLKCGPRDRARHDARAAVAPRRTATDDAAAGRPARLGARAPDRRARRRADAEARGCERRRSGAGRLCGRGLRNRGARSGPGRPRGCVPADHVGSAGAAA